MTLSREVWQRDRNLDAALEGSVYMVLLTPSNERARTVGQPSDGRDPGLTDSDRERCSGTRPLLAGRHPSGNCSSQVH